jgi:hypothetical protein
MAEELAAVKNTDSMKEGQEHGHAGPFIMRRTIRNTAYEVAVYFSQTSRETLNDKILRLIRNEVHQ